MNSVQLMTQSAYARHRGVAKSAVHRAVSEKRITLVDGKVDAKAADLDWARNTMARPIKERAAPAPKPTKATRRAAPAAPAPAPPAPPPPMDHEPQDNYATNRARREKAEADLAQMKVLEMQGDLVRVVEVRAEIGKQIGQLRANVLQIPARLQHLLSPEGHAALTAELRAVLANLNGPF